jgi:hypothetical protein
MRPALEAVLSGEQARRVTLSFASNGRLILLVDSAAIAARLRQLQPRLLNSFRRYAPEVSELRIEVQAQPRFRRGQGARRRIEATALAALAALAVNVRDARLRSALERLIVGQASNREHEALERKEGDRDRGQHQTVLHNLPGESQPASILGEEVDGERRADREQNQKADEA